jgi:probable rRNA maturation factor
MSRAVQVDVQVAADLSSVPEKSEIQTWLEQVIAQVGTDTDRDVEISVKIVDEVEGQELNRRFRQQESATNVLSFPLADASLKDVAIDSPLALGDIVICEPVVAREASEQGKRNADHWAHLLVHGALHLMGYDHETDIEAQEMETLEARILALGGVENPYETRD